MLSPKTNGELHALIARMHDPIDVDAIADDQANRIMIRLSLCRPIPLSAAMKFVAMELGHGRTAEIEATARALHGKLLRRHDKPDVSQ